LEMGNDESVSIQLSWRNSARSRSHASRRSKGESDEALDNI